MTIVEISPHHEQAMASDCSHRKRNPSCRSYYVASLDHERKLAYKLRMDSFLCPSWPSLCLALNWQWPPLSYYLMTTYSDCADIV